ncbi:hypothetical protein FSP39_012850 [Pinctada imbricata]|uniref:Ferritin n=1 Tax=Pinctada imbricata TaxID=66713 RepID=A0AA88YA76_PINIB|nr:hypothetical protein FSP39_012850 [Pinctada imbricata]
MSSGNGCPHGYMAYTGSCYLFSREKLTWYHASMKCEYMGGYLAVANSAHENSYFKLMSEKLSIDDEVWIGLNDVLFSKIFIWEGGYKQCKWWDWFGKEPITDGAGYRHCVAMGKDYKIIQQNFPRLSQKGINKQISQCLDYSFQFLAMSQYFERADVALPGFQKLFFEASERERKRALELISYMNKRGGFVELTEISLPVADNWNNGVSALRKALDLSKRINNRLLSLVDVATKKQDPHLKHFLEHNFLDKQIVVIKQLGDYITQLTKLLNDNRAGLGLYLFDKSLL